MPVSLGIASVSGLLAMAAANRWMPDSGQQVDLTPERVINAPRLESPPKQGHVMISIEYQVDPARALEFRDLMFNESRRSRLRHGARAAVRPAGLHPHPDPGLAARRLVRRRAGDRRPHVG